MSATIRGRGGVYELDLPTGSTSALAAGDIALSVSSAIEGPARVRRHRAALPAEPGEIAVVDTPRARSTAITDANPWFKQVQVAADARR